MRPVPLRAIADRVGCTRSTVSYALNNHPKISEPTRRRVQAVALELGWRPNARLARQMALVRETDRGATDFNLAVLIRKGERRLQDETTPRKHLEGARARVDQLGYGLTTFDLEDQPMSPERLSGILRARGVQGIVYIATVDPEMRAEYLEIGREFACAVVGLRNPHVPYHVALNDAQAAGRLAVTEIRKLGHRRIGALVPRWLDEELDFAVTGGIAAGNVDVPEGDRVPTLHCGLKESYLPPSAYGRICGWMELHSPDAILTTDSYHSAMALARMPAPWRTVPIYGLDYHPEVEPRCAAGVAFSQEAVGAAGVDLVVAQLHRGERGLPVIQRSLQLEGTWVVSPFGDTVRFREEEALAAR